MLEPPTLSESPTFIRNKPVKSLEKYVDYELDDNCSFLSDDQNYSSEENAKLSSFARKLSGWTDAFSRAFIRQWPKRHIDNQDQSQFVSREESEYRLLLLFISFSLISCIVTTGLLISCSFNCINKDTITLYPRQQPNYLKGLTVPHILVIHQNGRMSDYSTNETLSPSRNVSMKLTCSNVYEKFYGAFAPNRSCYTFAYADLQNIYIFYGNAKRDMTYIDCQSFDYGTMSGTKLKNQHIEGIATKVGEKFIMLGENDYMDDLLLGLWDHPPLYNTQHKCFRTEVTIWSDRKQKFFNHRPDFIEATVEYTCITGFNRTHFLLVNKPFTDGEVSMVDIDTWTMTAMPSIPYSYPWISRVTCDVEFGKESLRLIAISKMHGLDENSSMYQYNFQTEEWSESKTNLKYFGTLRIVNGIKYFFNIMNTESHFGYYHNAKEGEWIQLSVPGHYEKKLDVGWQSSENVVAVPYYA